MSGRGQGLPRNRRCTLMPMRNRETLRRARLAPFEARQQEESLRRELERRQRAFRREQRQQAQADAQHRRHRHEMFLVYCENHFWVYKALLQQSDTRQVDMTALESKLLRLLVNKVIVIIIIILLAYCKAV